MQPHLCAGVTQKTGTETSQKICLAGEFQHVSHQCSSAPSAASHLHRQPCFIIWWIPHLSSSSSSLCALPQATGTRVSPRRSDGAPPPWRSPLLKSHAVCVVGTTPKAWRWSLPLRWPDTPSVWMMGRELTNEGEEKKDRKEAAGWGMMRVFLFIFCYLVVL